MFDPLIIAGREFGSRLFLGTAGYPNRVLMLDAIARFVLDGVIETPIRAFGIERFAASTRAAAE